MQNINIKNTNAIFGKGVEDSLWSRLYYRPNVEMISKFQGPASTRSILKWRAHQTAIDFAGLKADVVIDNTTQKVERLISLCAKACQEVYGVEVIKSDG